MKRIVKRTTTTEEWVDPDGGGHEDLDAVDDEGDIEHDENADQDEDAEEEARHSRARRRR